MAKLISFLWFTICLLSVGTPGYAERAGEKRIYPHYDLQLGIDPQKHEIEVKGSLEFDLGQLKDDMLVFYLDRGLQLNYFRLNGWDNAVIDPEESDNRFMPMARKIFVELKALAPDEQIAVITFSYRGKLSELPEIYANRIGSDWTELGMYYPWFPYSINQLRSFTFDLSITAPARYEVFGLGSLKKSNGSTEISSFTPTTDMVVCLSGEVKINSFETGANQIRIFHHSFEQTMVDDIAKSITMILAHFNEWFGRKKTDISLIESRRESGGGYARSGGVVLSDLNREQFYQDILWYEKYFAHEFAHLWWYKADVNSWEDWINESFAEYSALMIIREKHGKEAFLDLVEGMEKSSRATPPVWGFARSAEKQELVHQVLCQKGPVLLHELEQMIGRDDFLGFCAGLIAGGISKTSELLQLLESTCGKEVRDKFESMLKTR